MTCQTKSWLPLFAVILCCNSLALAQPSSAPLKANLVGQYTWNAPGGGMKSGSFDVELSQIKIDGESVSGILSKFRNPNGRCVADNTPLKGSYKDGTLSLETDPLKSQMGNQETCRSVKIQVKLEGGRGDGLLTLGNNTGWPLYLESK